MSDKTDRYHAASCILVTLSQSPDKSLPAKEVELTGVSSTAKNFAASVLRTHEYLERPDDSGMGVWKLTHKGEWAAQLLEDGLSASEFAKVLRKSDSRHQKKG